MNQVGKLQHFNMDENIKLICPTDEKGICLNKYKYCKKEVHNYINMTQANKKDKGKPRVELVPPEFIIDLSKVLQFGADKYGRDNWRKGLPWTRIYASALRHLLAWVGGEKYDKESGMPHLLHAIANLMFLYEYNYTHPELDDRYKIIKKR